MILDIVDNIERYFCLGKRIKKALEYIRDNDFSTIEKGKHLIDGENIFALVNDYDTKLNNECLMEAHKKYIDLQYMYEGSELIGHQILSNQETTVEYNKDLDYAIFKPDNYSILILEKGQFVLFFPNDLHMPGIMNKKSEKVRKIVIKILEE